VGKSAAEVKGARRSVSLSVYGLLRVGRATTYVRCARPHRGFLLLPPDRPHRRTRRLVRQCRHLGQIVEDCAAGYLACSLHVLSSSCIVEGPIESRDRCRAHTGPCASDLACWRWRRSLLRLCPLRMLANAPKTEQGKFTAFLPQQLSLHAEDRIDDLLLLASHGEKASGQLG
jgi:hypothetical protein